MLDVAVSYQRYRFIGAEFLTWLWYAIDAQPQIVAATATGRSGLALGNRIVVVNRRDSGTERLAIQGDAANFSEAMVALKKGGLVSELRLECVAGDHLYRFTVDADGLVISGLRGPRSAGMETPDDLEAAVLERIGQCEVVVDLVERLFRTFIELRLSDQWQRRVVPAIGEWIREAFV